MEPIYFGRRPGVVLHQPLNCADFRKNDENGQNMNGIPVSPERKMENAPTWRPPNPVFGTPFWGCFSANLLASSPINHVLSLLFLFLPLSNPTQLIIFIIRLMFIQELSINTR